MIAVSSEINNIFPPEYPFGKYDQWIVLCDSNTAEYCYPKLKPFLPAHHCINIPAGEEYKNLDTARMVWNQLLQCEATRNSLLINLGGGMVTDLGGFCASIYMRGIDFIHIPTTLLAMVDASMGGKTGVDLQHYKNYLGTFSDAKQIFINPIFLSSLPEYELRNGWAEVVKHGIIAGGESWKSARSIPAINDTENWTSVIKWNIETKTRIVSEDFRETGIRKTLNLGHTMGHALETTALNQNQFIGHGYCVAAGILMESYISNAMGILRPTDLQSISESIDLIYRRIPIPETWISEIASATKKDKKNRGNTVRMALPESIGKVLFDCEVGEDVILEALAHYGAG